MQQVAKLVKDRLDLAMRQQRRLGTDGRCQVAADETQVRVRSARDADQ